MQNDVTFEEKDVVKAQFTAYLVMAVRRQRKDYLKRLYHRTQYEVELEAMTGKAEPSEEMDLHSGLPLEEQLDNEQLLQGLKSMKERENYVFLAHTMEDKTFGELAHELGIGYKAVAAIYYRAAKKIQKKMEEEK